MAWTVKDALRRSSSARSILTARPSFTNASRRARMRFSMVRTQTRSCLAASGLVSSWSGAAVVAFMRRVSLFQDFDQICLCDGPGSVGLVQNPLPFLT